MAYTRWHFFNVEARIVSGFAAALCVWFALSAWSSLQPRALIDSIRSAAPNELQRQVAPRIVETESPRSASSAASLAQIRDRWEATWSTDVSASEIHVAHINSALALIARAESGDLEATVDLIGAATWCLSGGPLVNVSERVGNEQRPCFERFGESLASREKLERASFAWVLQLAAAGVDDATLYASALLRGVGPDVLGGAQVDEDVRQTQRALLIGQLQTLADRGSADAASELHGHWSGQSALQLRDERMAAFYGALTERLDPMRSLVTAK
jgi:hypothetical protein